MNRPATTCQLWPSWLRFFVVAAATLVLCSCRSATPHHRPPQQGVDAVLESASREPSLPYAAGPWQPPGIAKPWPHEEYLRDGGDFILPARVRSDWTVEGLEQEDTIAHFDTLDGRTIVRPSNRVHIYAPRFAAVRQVRLAGTQEVLDRASGVVNPVQPVRYDETQIATTTVQPRPPHGEVGTRLASTYRQRQQFGGLERRQNVEAFHDGFLVHENFQAIREGRVDQAEKARLAPFIQAAVTWAQDQAVQVILDEKQASILQGGQKSETVYRVDEPQSPELRIIKVASRHSARPGETVDFTLRYDNVGDQVIGNVTIIDNLSTRLEYLSESQQSSLEADFFAKPNEGGSEALRWEIKAPLKPGQGGVLRFRCQVR